MSFNFALAKEIYGLTAWHVDEKTFPGLIGTLNAIKDGATLDVPDIKYNSVELIEISNSQDDVRFVKREWQLDNHDVFRGIGIINIDGPITVGGGASSHGMRDVSITMQKMAEDDRVIGFIMLSDSGGGASGAVEIMDDTINEIKETKPVIGLIKKGGIAASAAYGILSACNFIYAESEMSIVGSAGTMSQFVGKAANSEDRDGSKYIRLYAPESTRKNEGFEEALNNDNYQIIRDDILKPINDDFLARIQRNRPMLESTEFRDGRTVFAKNGIGTFIDGIKLFNAVADQVLELAGVFRSNQLINTNNNNLNSKKMTLQELKQDHPELYQSVFDAGISSERDRAGAWMAHAATDIEAVKKGIESGDQISMTKTQEFIIKNASLSHIENLRSDSAEDIVTEEATTEDPAGEPENKEIEDFYAKVDEQLQPLNA